MDLSEVQNTILDRRTKGIPGSSEPFPLKELKNKKWNKGQVKTGLNQAPLFDLFDSTGTSFSTYTGSTFVGSTVFSYAVNTSVTADTELGFGLTYRNFNNIGDIVFHDNIIRDSFTYTTDVLNNTTSSVRLATGYLHK